MEEGGEHTSLLVKVRRTCCRLVSAESELALACLPLNGLFAGFGDRARQEQNWVLEPRAFVLSPKSGGLGNQVRGYESRTVEQADGHLIVSREFVTCMHSSELAAQL
jgi:hypothetical protein